jgi:hypothetical protein
MTLQFFRDAEFDKRFASRTVEEIAARKGRLAITAIHSQRPQSFLSRALGGTVVATDSFTRSRLRLLILRGIRPRSPRKVTVPHSQNGSPAVDSGPQYTVMGACP